MNKWKIGKPIKTEEIVIFMIENEIHCTKVKLSEIQLVVDISSRKEDMKTCLPSKEFYLPRVIT